VLTCRTDGKKGAKAPERPNNSYDFAKPSTKPPATHQALHKRAFVLPNVCSTTRTARKKARISAGCMAGDIRPPSDLIGPQVRRIRFEQRLSQPALAAKCQRLGWDIGRDIIARIEAQIRLVTDSELVFLARALGVSLKSLFPQEIAKQFADKKR
jgi:hypothetical protein